MIDLKDINIDKLTNNDLLHFVQSFKHNNSDYTSIIRMLPIATSYNTNRLRDVLQKIKDGRKPIAVYPSVDNIDTSKLEYIGEIDDGSMWLE